jgi:hypothetical protein
VPLALLLLVLISSSLHTSAAVFVAHLFYRFLLVASA